MKRKIQSFLFAAFLYVIAGYAFFFLFIRSQF